MAEDAIRSRVTALPEETRPLLGCIGRTLREDIFAERDNPPFDRVCMDGIAVDSRAYASGRRQFRMQAMQRAGVPALELAGGERAIEVMTGAVLPRGADCVIPLEEYDLADGLVTLKPEALGDAQRNVQRRGADSPPGVPMLRTGIRLGAPEIAVAASAGRAELRVSRQPSVMVISTGDELIEPGRPILDYQIRRSNSYAVVTALRARGLENVADDHILDDAEQLRERLAQHLANRDVLVLSGGVSKGKFDLVPQVLKELGVREEFYKVAQRPGMPMWFGVAPRGQAVFGLPGNPVSTLICVIRYVVPAIARAMGAPAVLPGPVALAARFKFHRSMTYFLPVTIRRDSDGRRLAEPRPPNGSGDFLSLAGSDGFVELPPRPEEFPAGFVADFYRW
jgi:molybdopterin molybdotransferase